MSSQVRVLTSALKLSLAVAAGVMFFVLPQHAIFAVLAAAMTLWLLFGGLGSVGDVVGAQTGAGTTETLAAIEGDLKVVYGKDLVQVMPDVAIIQKMYPLSEGGAFPLVGDYFSALIGVKFPWGFSFLGKGTESTATNTTLGDTLAGQTKPAKVYAATTVLTDNLAYQILDRAASSGSQQAVLSAMQYTGMQMAVNMRNVLELQILHGQEGLGASAGAISSTTVTFDGATTAVGILSTLLGARVQFFQSNLTSARTAHDSSNYLEVTDVNTSDPASPTVTLTATGTTNVAAITTGDVMFLGGSRGISVASNATSVPFYEQLGLMKQLRLTSGDVFDLSRTTYQPWRPNTQATIGTFSPSALVSGAALSMNRGGIIGEYVACLPVDAWSVLNSALATNEVYNQQGPSAYSMKRTGTDDIEVRSGGIKINCLSHPFQKRGLYGFWPKSEVHRIGSTDVTFAIPGRKGGEEYYFPVNGYAAMQRQCRADFQVALLNPPSSVYGSGITY